MVRPFYRQTGPDAEKTIINYVYLGTDQGPILLGMCLEPPVFDPEPLKRVFVELSQNWLWSVLIVITAGFSSFGRPKICAFNLSGMSYIYFSMLLDMDRG